MNIKSFYVILLLFILAGCIDPYQPAAIEENVNVLVVDGFLNTTTKTITVNLSRTLPIYSDSPEYPHEENAIVFLEDENNVRQALVEIEPGLYTKENLLLNLSKKYRIHITTTAEEYRSEYVNLNQSPSIDEVNWEGLENGVQISVSTHDPANQTRYYQWKLTETWLYTASYFSNIKAMDDTVLYKTSDELTYVCYKTEGSKQILIESTTRLSEDIVNDFPLFLIPKGSAKVANRYSVLVEQRALNADAYNYLLQLKKTTETMGGLFDPLPAQLIGNMYNVKESSSAVIGYFMGGSVQEKRIFINFNQLPQHLRKIDYPPFYCAMDTVTKVETYSLYPEYQILEGYPYADVDYPHQFDQYIVTTQKCTDCRLKDNGTITRPDFW